MERGGVTGVGLHLLGVLFAMQWSGDCLCGARGADMGDTFTTSWSGLGGGHLVLLDVAITASTIDSQEY